MSELLYEGSYKCSLNCLHCSSTGCEGKQLDVEVIPEWLLRKVDTVRISGGEPTERPIDDLLDEIDYFKTRGLKTILQTNGYNYEYSGEVFEAVDEVHVSLYGEQDIHEFITRTRRSYDYAKTVLQWYKNASIVTPLFNLVQVNQVATLGEKLNVPVRITSLVNQGRCNIALPIEKQRADAHFLTHFFKNVELTCSLTDKPCESRTKYVIKPDGSIMNCASTKQGVKTCPKYTLS